MPEYPQEPFPLDGYPNNEAAIIFNADWSLTQYGIHTLAISLFSDMRDAEAERVRTGRRLPDVYDRFSRTKLKIPHVEDRQELRPWLEDVLQRHENFYKARRAW